jgi:hypothetical protein
MQFPRVNLNGTGKADLLNQQLEMLAALRLAAKVMAANSPHGRDYYLIDSDATSRAFAEHMARRKAVDDIIGEIEAIALNIDEQ